MPDYLTKLIAAHVARGAPRVVRLGECRLECRRHVFNPGLAVSSPLFVRILQELRFDGQFVVDAGCGVGVLGISAAQAGAGRVLAFDCDAQAVETARRNAKANGIAAFDAVVADGIPDGVGDVDAIVCDPPFFDRQLAEPWHRAFSDPGHAFFRKTLEQAASVLKPGGCLLLASGGDLSSARVRREASRRGWDAEELGKSDGELRVSILRMRRVCAHPAIPGGDPPL